MAEPPEADGSHRANVRAVSRALQGLHKALLFRASGGGAPQEILARAFSDPELAWLRPVSQMIVELDQLTELESVTETYARRARARVQDLLASEAFTSRFVPLGQDDPESAGALAEVRIALRELPQADG